MTRDEAIKKIKQKRHDERLMHIKEFFCEYLPIALIGILVLAIVILVVMWPLIVHAIQVHKYGEAKRWTDIAAMISVLFWLSVIIIPMIIYGFKESHNEKKKRFEEDINYELAWDERKARLLPQVPDKLKDLGYIENENCDIISIWVHDRLEIVNVKVKSYDCDYIQQLTLYFNKDDEELTQEEED